MPLIYRQATPSSDNNARIMEAANKGAAKPGPTMPSREKPFAGINGYDKHNWPVGTNTGLNLSYPGKTDPARHLFTSPFLRPLRRPGQHVSGYPVSRVSSFHPSLPGFRGSHGQGSSVPPTRPRTSQS